MGTVQIRALKDRNVGVLTIVGVLSVGGIAGYSKAMEKFKINKTVKPMNNIFYNFLLFASNFDDEPKYLKH